MPRMPAYVAPTAAAYVDTSISFVRGNGGDPHRGAASTTAWQVPHRDLHGDRGGPMRWGRQVIALSPYTADLDAR